MTDSTVTQKEDVEDVETETEKPTDGTQVKAKTFTQAEVDDIIRKRLEKEKRGFKQDRDAWDAERQALQDELNQIDESFASEVEELSKGIDPDVLELLDGLSNREKVAKLKKLQGKLTKIEIKETKKGSGDSTPQYTRRNSV